MSELGDYLKKLNEEKDSVKATVEKINEVISELMTKLYEWLAEYPELKIHSKNPTYMEVTALDEWMFEIVGATDILEFKLGKVVV